MTVVLLLSDSYLRESTEESWTEMAEPLVELSRPGCESLDFKLTDINPSTVANVNAFRVSIAMATTNTEFHIFCNSLAGPDCHPEEESLIKFPCVIVIISSVNLLSDVWRASGFHFWHLLRESGGLTEVQFMFTLLY